MANVSLGDKFEEYIQKKLKSGEYASASELIREALRLKMQMEAIEQAKLNALRRDIGDAWQEAEDGKCTDFDVDEFLGSLDKKTRVKR